MDPLSDGERDQLRAIEEDLRRSDPRLARVLAPGPVTLHRPVLTFGLLLLVAIALGLDGEVFLLGLRSHRWWLLLLAAGGFPLAVLPLRSGLLRSVRPGDS